MVWATHLVDEIADGDDLIVLHRGRVLAQGPVSTIVAQAGRASRGAFTRLTQGADAQARPHERRRRLRRRAFSLAQYAICLKGIVWREALRFLHQRERFVSALVRPLVWLFIFAAGFRQVLGISIIPPYETYILYEVYITPGLMAMIQLFNGMQSSLSMVYDREMGNMRTLLVSPLPRWYLLSCKLVAGTAVSLLQVYAFLAIAYCWEIEPPPIGYLTVLPALVLSGLMLGALGMLISSAGQAAGEFRRRDELRDLSDVLRVLGALSALARAGRKPGCSITSASSIRSPMRSSWSALRSMARSIWISLAVVCGCTAVFMIGAILAYDPARGLIARRGGPGGDA